MATVRLISTSIVHGGNNDASGDERIELNPWDLQHLQLEYIQEGLVFPKPKLLTETLIPHLKTSLSHALHHFPPLVGRLATTQHQDDDTVSFFIDCNDTGALFIHAAADGVTVSDIIKPVYVPPVVHSCFPLNGLYNYNGITNPLEYNLSKPPVFRRWFADGMDIPIRIPRSSVDVTQCNDDFIRPPIRERIFHFSKETIAKLKEKANDEIGSDNISSLQALLSHTWGSVVRSRSLDPNEETKYCIIVGARQRFRELPDGYFGNAILGTFVTMKAKEVLEQGIGKPAWRMNRTIATMTGECFKRLFKPWLTSPHFVTLSNGDALTASNSPRFNTYGNDFGWGKPIAVRCGPSNKCDGMLTLYCGAEEGSIDVEVCLFPEALEALASDQEFMDTVTN
ncbi:HXXXD-type acyl-transferase family protein [Hibiscus syriacus]|uniref:HXXXD-type acyl-transferase family protein n=1 Tax=Hibiscus syriacus TaxID=106335 RepID=A0A6A2ZS77_HIBSY|nr:HXXXD-type acyl-transferase family protein [Hibiscus syriacus]